jgi:hypothetical protein
MITIVDLLEFRGWNVAAVLVESPVVEPVDIRGRLGTNVRGIAPGPPWFDQLGLVQAINRLGERVVMRLSGQSKIGSAFGPG